MSTPNEPRDPFQPSEGSSGDSGAPQYGQTPPPYGQTPGETPSYGQYGAPQDPAGGGYPSYPAGQPGQAPAYGYPKNNLGVWALVLGIVGVLCCGFAGVAAVILGNNAKKAVARGEANNGSLANAGYILGWVGIGLWVLGLILRLTGVIDTSFDF